MRADSIELRAPTLDDVPAVTQLINRVTDELYGEHDETEEIVRQYVTAPDLDPDEDIRVAVDGDAAIAGYADVTAHPHPTYWLDIRVPPSGEDATRRALVAWALERARRQNGAAARSLAWEKDLALRAVLETEGFRLIRHGYRMRIDFDGHLEEPRWPEGVAVRAMTQANAQAAYMAHMETFEDVWEHAPMPIEEWRHWLVDEDHDWSLWFLAEAGDEVAAVALCRRRPAEPDVGVVRVLGVRRAWRRKGVGRALLLHVFGEFGRRGCSAVALGVDAESLTGANRLYESAGMRVVRRSDIFERPLAR